MTVIDEVLVSRLVATQFPRWAGRGVTPVARQGWDNRTYRLGDDMKVRLPTAAGYATQVEKEALWLPVLSPGLPVEIPRTLAVGEPGDGYPFPWSVQTWAEGEPAEAARISDNRIFAADVAGFLRALWRIDATGGPAAGPHSFRRGGDLRVYDEEARRAAGDLAGDFEQARVLSVWDAALASRWGEAPVWVHGDMAAGNLLAQNGRLTAVIDFGCLAVGDPACDLAIAWTFFDPAGWEAFRDGVSMDEATWRRARGWALWKALITLAADRERVDARGVIASILTEAS